MLLQYMKRYRSILKMIKGRIKISTNHRSYNHYYFGFRNAHIAMVSRYWKMKWYLIIKKQSSL
jgi:hypothetical protein